MAEKVPNLDKPLESLLDMAVREFGEVQFETVTIGERSLEVLQVKQMQKYLDKLMDKTRAGKKISLPLWAKIWPSSLLLGYTLTKFPIADGAAILEVGAGCAVNGMVLAALGHDVTVTDLDPNALLFSKINALKNGLEDNLQIRQVDFTKDHLGVSYDYIIGCEVLYEEAIYEKVADFLDDHLSDAAHAEILLAMDQKRQGAKFFERASEKFRMMKSAADYKDKESGEENSVNLYRLKRKAA